MGLTFAVKNDSLWMEEEIRVRSEMSVYSAYQLNSVSHDNHGSKNAEHCLLAAPFYEILSR